MVSFRIDTELLDKINRLKEPKTDVIHKALELYLDSSENVNTPYKENVNTKRNTTVNTINQVNQAVNHDYKEKHDKTVNQAVNHSQQKEHSQKVNQVNPGIQVIENYELLQYLKRDNEWLKGRVEHFEHTQDKIFARLDIKVKKETEITRYRM